MSDGVTVKCDGEGCQKVTVRRAGDGWLAVRGDGSFLSAREAAAGKGLDFCPECQSAPRVKAVLYG